MKDCFCHILNHSSFAKTIYNIYRSTTHSLSRIQADAPREDAMKKIISDDDYWQPRPGSWEEAVDPYDVQSTRELTQQNPNEQTDMPMEVIADSRPQYGRNYATSG